MAVRKQLRDGKTARGSQSAWSYRPGNTLLHRCPAGIKLAALFVLTASPAWNLPAMGGAAALILGGSLCAGIGPPELFTGSRPLLVMLAFVTLFRALDLPPSFNTEAFAAGLYFSGGILLSFAAGSLFFSLTTMTEIRRFLEKAELFILRPFGKRKQGRLSLALALMLGFLPRFFELWEGAELACKARHCTGPLRRLIIILPLVSERMMKTAGETAAALESRGLEL